MAYSYATFAAAKADLAQRLYESLSDTTRTFWTDSELGEYIRESLRCWNAYTSFWREAMTFNLTQGVNWYDLPSRPSSVRPYTVTDNDILRSIEYHLLEPVTASYPLTWGGSTQFDLGDIVDNITQAHNQTIGTSGCTITRSAVSAPIIRQRIVLSQDVITIRRVAWLPTSTYKTAALRQADEWEKRSFDANWTTNASQSPRTWLQSTEPPVSFDVDNVPPVTGSYEILTVNAGPDFNLTAAQVLSVPDDWSWLVKWNALENLFGREGVAKDATRQAYCEQRFAHGLSLLATTPAVLGAKINGRPVECDAVRNGDDFNPLWQGRVQGTPNKVYVAGLNLVGFSPPDAGPYSVLLSVVQNAPLPASDADFVQIAKEDYSSLLDHAQHLAAFKMGGLEFTRTIPLLQSFLDRAGLYNAKLKQMGPFPVSQMDISQREAQRTPVR
jgi:hypothetical protein